MSLERRSQGAGASARQRLPHHLESGLRSGKGAATVVFVRGVFLASLQGDSNREV